MDVACAAQLRAGGYAFYFGRAMASVTLSEAVAQSIAKALSTVALA